jgi:hypothetical protein
MAYQKGEGQRSQKHYTIKTKIGKPHEHVGELVLITRRDWMLFDWSYLLRKWHANLIFATLPANININCRLLHQSVQ